MCAHAFVGMCFVMWRMVSSGVFPLCVRVSFLCAVSACDCIVIWLSSGEFPLCSVAHLVNGRNLICFVAFHICSWK